MVGSPPHTIDDSLIAPVHPERLNRSSGRGARVSKSRAAAWYCSAYRLCIVGPGVPSADTAVAGVYSPKSSIQPS